MKKSSGRGVAQLELEKAELSSGQFNKNEHRQAPFFERSAPFMNNICGNRTSQKIEPLK